MTPIELTQEYEQFVQDALEQGLYSSRDDLLNDALRSLQLEREWRKHAEEGTRQLQNGEFTGFDDESLAEYFDDVKRRGRDRLAAKESAP